MHTPASLTINAETKLRAPLHSRLAAFVRFISLLGRSSVSQVLAKAPHKPDIGKPESVVSRNARLIVCLGVGCELSAALRPPLFLCDLQESSANATPSSLWHDKPALEVCHPPTSATLRIRSDR
jgi:hypothetical protein